MFTRESTLNALLDVQRNKNGLSNHCFNLVSLMILCLAISQLSIQFCDAKYMFTAVIFILNSLDKRRAFMHLRPCGYCVNVHCVGDKTN